MGKRNRDKGRDRDRGKGRDRERERDKERERERKKEKKGGNEHERGLFQHFDLLKTIKHCVYTGETFVKDHTVLCRLVINKLHFHIIKVTQLGRSVYLERLLFIV